jgi:putative transposase
MGKSRFGEARIIGILKELKAGKKSATLCREHGISEATLYSWRSKYAGLEVPSVSMMGETR